MAVTVASDDEDRQRIERQWADFGVPIELHTVYSPYRELTRPIMRFIDELDSQYGDDIITVVIPEFVTSWGTQWLHNGARSRSRPGCCTDRTPPSCRCPFTCTTASSMRSRGVQEGQMHVIVVGCGRVGSTVAGELVAGGHDVVVIDRRREAFRRLGPDFAGTTMTGVGFDRELLSAARITDRSAVMAVTSGDNSNILIARVARETLGSSAWWPASTTRNER